MYRSNHFFYSSILLVRILDETLVLGDEPRHDSVVTLCHLVLDILGTLAYRLDGLVNSKTKRMPEKAIPTKGTLRSAFFIIHLKLRPKKP